MSRGRRLRGGVHSVPFGTAHSCGSRPCPGGPRSGPWRSLSAAQYAVGSGHARSLRERKKRAVSGDGAATIRGGTTGGGPGEAYGERERVPGSGRARRGRTHLGRLSSSGGSGRAGLQRQLQVPDVVDHVLQELHFRDPPVPRQRGHQRPESRVAALHVIQQRGGRLLSSDSSRARPAASGFPGPHGLQCPTGTGGQRRRGGSGDLHSDERQWDPAGGRGSTAPRSANYRAPPTGGGASWRAATNSSAREAGTAAPAPFMCPDGQRLKGTAVWKVELGGGTQECRGASRRCGCSRGAGYNQAPPDPP